MAVLIGVPYHTQKRYCRDRLLDWLEDQTGHEVIVRVDTAEYGRKGVFKEQLELFRRLALERGVDYLLIVEADTIPPHDAVERLLAHRKDVVGALFRYRTPEAPVVAWPKENITEGLCEVEGMGTGCILLSKKAFTSFTFYDWNQQDADWPMCERLRELGFKIYLDTDVVCRHYADTDTYY